MSSRTPCRGSGKGWTVNNAGHPICPGCHRGLSTIAGYGRTPRNTRIIPQHNRPGPQDAKQPRRTP